MTNAGLREIFTLQREMDGILAQPTIGKEARKRADILMAKIASIRDMGCSTDESHRALAAEFGREIRGENENPEQRAHEEMFRAFLRGNDFEERNTFLAGTQTLVYSAGSAGGFLVPQKFYQAAAEGMAAVDPLLDENIVTLISEPDYSLRPLELPGWDLSAVKATKVGEISQESAASVPTLDQPLLNKFAYRIAFDASLEWDEDAKAYGDPMTALGRACGIGMARGIGEDLVVGDGSSAPQGIVTGSADSGVTSANVGKLVLGDFTNVFYSINKAYRESPKGSWLVNDAVAKMISNCVDDQHRPLFPIVDGITYVLGKPVYVCPSLPAYNASLGTQQPGSFCVFGDLSHYYVHASSILMRRLLQVPGLVEYGKVRYHALQMVDAVVNDPTNGSLPPIVSARLHS